MFFSGYCKNKHYYEEEVNNINDLYDYCPEDGTKMDWEVCKDCEKHQDKNLDKLPNWDNNDDNTIDHVALAKTLAQTPSAKKRAQLKEYIRQEIEKELIKKFLNEGLFDKIKNVFTGDSNTEDVQSSNLRKIKYNKRKNKLWITFRDKNNSTYEYDKIPPEVFEELKAANSKGKYFHYLIRSRYPYRKIGSNKI